MVLKFNTQVVDWGTLPHNAGKVNFEFRLEEGEIFAIKPSCAGCTYVTVDGNLIKGNINIEKAASKPTNGPIQVSKIIHVWENDGEPWFDIDPVTKIRKNRKKSVNLEIKFTVT